jgi:hypothetical protein
MIATSKATTPKISNEVEQIESSEIIVIILIIQILKINPDFKYFII